MTDITKLQNSLADTEAAIIAGVELVHTRTRLIYAEAIIKWWRPLHEKNIAKNMDIVLSQQANPESPKPQRGS